MKFSVVTPSYNRATYLNETILSVISQVGNFEIEYVVQDGGSSAEVIKILEYWDQQINAKQFVPRCRGLSFRWYTEKDNGMYDAINRGFDKTTGGIMSWINTDDLYHPYAFETLSNIFSHLNDVFWVTGIPNSYNESGSRVGIDTFPNCYSREFIKNGFYDVKYLKYGFNWIQQESTFWKRELWESTGGKLDTSKRYAADFYLWKKFAEHCDLVKIYSFLGGYRSHPDQITADPEKYRGELDNTISPSRGLLTMKFILDNFPYLKGLIYNKHRGKGVIDALGLQWEWIMGRTIEWSFSNKQWEVRWHGIMGNGV